MSNLSSMARALGDDRRPLMVDSRGARTHNRAGTPEGFSHSPRDRNGSRAARRPDDVESRGRLSSQTSRSRKSAAAAHPDKAELYQSAYQKAKFRLLAVLVPVVMLSIINRTVSAYAAPEQVRSLGITERDVGISTSVYYLSYAVFCLPSLWAAKRLSMRHWMAGSLALWGVITMATAAVETREQLIASRFALGATDSALQPIVYAYLDLYFQPSDVAEIWASWFLSAIVIAAVQTLPIAKLIIGGLVGASGSFAGWQWIFLIMGTAGVAAGLLVHFLLLDTPARTSILTPQEKALLAGMKAQLTCTNEVDGDADPVCLPFFTWRTAHLGAMGILHNGLMVSFMFFTPGLIEVILIQAGVVELEELEDGATYLLLVPAVCTVGMLKLVANMIRNTNSKWRGYAGVGTLGASLFLALLWPAVYQPTSSPVLAFAYLCILQGVTASFAAVLDSFPALHMQAEGAAPAYFAALSALRSLSPIFSPVIFAQMIGSVGGGAALAINGLVNSLGLIALCALWCHQVGEGISFIYRAPEALADE